MFGGDQHCACRTKGKKPGSIRKEKYDKPGDIVSVEQLQQAQTFLVSKRLGKIIGAQIWDAQVTVEHFIDMVYTNL